MKNPNHRFMEQNLSMAIHRKLLIGVGVSDHLKVYYQFHTKFKQHIKNFISYGDVSEHAFKILGCLRSPIKPSNICG